MKTATMSESTNRNNGFAETSLATLATSLSTNGHALHGARDFNLEEWGWRKLRKMARRQIDKFIALVPDTLRDGNLDAVNKMRVTSRRLELLLDLLYPKPLPRRIRKLRRRLKECRRKLGVLRNYDALLAMVEESLALQPASGLEVWQAVKEYLQRRRLRRASNTLQKLGKLNLTSSYVKFKRDLDSDSVFPPAPANGEPAHWQGEERRDLKERIIKSLSHRWRAFEDAVEQSRRDPREEVIHRMRIAAKRLRYLTEAMEKLHIEHSSEILAWLRTLQQTVGRWHDLELLEHAMVDMLAQPTFRNDHPGLRAEVRKIIQHNRETKQTLERKFSWMTGHSRHYHGTKKWVAELIANGNHPAAPSVQ